MADFKKMRQDMVDAQIKKRGIQDAAVLKAMSKIPREEFVREEDRGLAYEDRPLFIGEGQTISQPYIVALMAELARIHPNDKVLEIGTGSGYSAAVLSFLASQVYSVEWYPILAMKAQQALRRLGVDNVMVFTGDGTRLAKDFAPFDAIIVTAGGESIPPSFLEQLKMGGRLVIPVGDTTFVQELMLVTKVGPDKFTYRNEGFVRFVSLLGQDRSINS